MEGIPHLVICTAGVEQREDLMREAALRGRAGPLHEGHHLCTPSLLSSDHLPRYECLSGHILEQRIFLSVEKVDKPPPEQTLLSSDRPTWVKSFRHILAQISRLRHFERHIIAQVIVLTNVDWHIAAQGFLLRDFDTYRSCTLVEGRKQLSALVRLGRKMAALSCA